MTTGILLTNTGTPDAPTPLAVRRYLCEFLSDPRVVHLPKIIWLPILYGFILPFRSKKSAALYKSIWQPDGSPMRVIMNNLAKKIEAAHNYIVNVGMNYGNPSIESALHDLRNHGATNIIALPLFPQFSHTTTSSSFDRLDRAIKKLNFQIPVTRIQNYADHPGYIDALKQSVINHWQKHNKQEHLLISFHGIPKRFVKEGDPYQSQTETTAQLLASALRLKQSEWTLCYQSQFGYDLWLKPSTHDLFIELPTRGIKSIDIICPGFPVDCLETLEEIAVLGQQTFHQAGGNSFRYIPCLNDSELNVRMLRNIVNGSQRANVSRRSNGEFAEKTGMD